MTVFAQTPVKDENGTYRLIKQIKYFISIKKSSWVETVFLSSKILP